LAGAAFFGPALQWLREADYRMYATWAGLALYCSLYFPVAIFLLRRLDRRTRLPLVVTVPVVWTALEFFRAHFGTGFAWYFHGHTQHAILPVIQTADLAGVYAVTFVLAAVNAALFELLSSTFWFRKFFGLPAIEPAQRPISLAIQSLVVVLLLGCTLGYGFYRLNESDFRDGPRISLIQGNVDQRLKIAAKGPDADQEAADAMIAHYKDLSNQAVAQNPLPDLVVWPETSFPDEWWFVAPDVPPQQVPAEWVRADLDCHRLARDAAARWHTNVLFGLNTRLFQADQRNVRYNSALLIQSDGLIGGRYDKIHRVPFGEYVPFRDSLPFMKKLAPYDFDYCIQPGDRQTRFTLTGPGLARAYRFGVIICYEDTDPYLARQFVDPSGGADPVDFVLNISNDGWFNGSSEHEEHLAICRFRAIECRRAVARAVNMGISAVIDGNGRVIALPRPSWAESKQVADVVTAVIPIDQRFSVYALWGDWLPWGCWIMLGIAMVGTFRRVSPLDSPIQ
jgi:apolipoprotein N-acyltransferase